MYDLVVGTVSEDTDYFFCGAPGDSSQLIRPVVCESPSEFLAVFATKGNHIPLLETPLRLLHSDGEQAAALLLDRSLRAGIKSKPATRLRGKPDPTLSRGHGWPLCNEQRTDSFAAEYVGYDVWTAAVGDDDVLTSERCQSGSLQLARHSATAEVVRSRGGWGLLLEVANGGVQLFYQ